MGDHGVALAEKEAENEKNLGTMQAEQTRLDTENKAQKMKLDRLEATAADDQADCDKKERQLDQIKARHTMELSAARTKTDQETKAHDETKRQNDQQTSELRAKQSNDKRTIAKMANDMINLQDAYKRGNAGTNDASRSMTWSYQKFIVVILCLFLIY